MILFFIITCILVFIYYSLLTNISGDFPPAQSLSSLLWFCFHCAWLFPPCSAVLRSLPLVRDGHRRHAGQAGVLWAGGHHGGGRAGGSGEPQVHPPLPHLQRGLRWVTRAAVSHVRLCGKDVSSELPVVHLSIHRQHCGMHCTRYSPSFEYTFVLWTGVSPLVESQNHILFLLFSCNPNLFHKMKTLTLLLSCLINKLF